MAAVSLCFNSSWSFRWKIKNPFMTARPLESEIFSFDGAQWKISLAYSNMMDCFPFILRKINREGRLSDFDFELFIQSGDKNLQRVTADSFKVFDSSPLTLWLPSRNFIRQLSTVLFADEIWTFLFVLTAKITRQEEAETVCNCHERLEICAAQAVRTEEKDCKVSVPKPEDSRLDCVEALTHDLHHLLDGGALADVQLMCGELTISAHRNILSARSEVFATMLRTDMAENRTGIIEISDMEVPVFNQFVHFIYTGKLPDLTTDTAPELYMAGDKYAIESLRIRCAAFIKENLTEENACNVLVFADVHNDKDLKRHVIDFIIRQELPQKDNMWLPFCERYPKLGIEVFSLAYKEKCELK